jgi:phosphatidylglycerophosphate synthase
VILGWPLAGGVTLTLFVGLDIIDGVIARGINSDDAYRRGLDSVIDRTIVVAFFFGAAFRVHAFLAAAAIIGAMNLVILPFAVATWRKYRVIFKAPRWHRSWTIMLFAAGLLYFSNMITESVLMALCGAICMSICTASLIYAHATLENPEKRWTVE